MTEQTPPAPALSSSAPSPVAIRGSLGEGGGQVLRTSLALSLLTGRPLHIDEIRAGRKTPGLQRQHLTAVQAAAEISGAEVRGASLGSTSLDFHPGPVRAGTYTFDIGTAGSATLVLQTVILPLLLADGPSTVTVHGGTHNSAAPPFEFLELVFLPALAKMGAEAELELVAHGFYPAGGGTLVLKTSPCAQLARLEWVERGDVCRLWVKALVSELPKRIGDREVHVVRSSLEQVADAQCVVVDSPGPGNVIMVGVECEHITEVFTGFGQRGLRAEAIAHGVADKVDDYLECEVPVGAYLADQLLLPMAIAGGGRVRSLAPTRHTRTNAEVIQHFLEVDISFEPDGEGCECVVRAR